MTKIKVLRPVNIQEIACESVVGLLLGLLLIFIPATSLLQFIIIVTGVFLMISSGIKLYRLILMTNNGSTNEMLFVALRMVVGFLLIVLHSKLIVFISAAYLLVEPIVLYIMSKFSLDILLLQLPKLALGVVLLVGGLSTLNLVFIILGIILCLLSIGYFVYYFIVYRRSKIKIVN